MAAGLDSLFMQATIVEETQMFRATLATNVTHFLNGKLLADPAYMSTARSMGGVQRHFPGYRFGEPALLEISCPAGSRVLDLELNKDFGDHEEELLFKRDSVFNLLSHAEVRDKIQMQQYMWDVDLTRYTVLHLFKLQHLP